MTSNDLIAFHKGNISWQESIRLAVSLLVKNNIAESGLADEIIKSTLKYGPYYVIAEKVALAHTAVCEYNKKPGMSLVIFENAIKFSENQKHEVNLLFCMSQLILTLIWAYYKNLRILYLKKI